MTFSSVSLKSFSKHFTPIFHLASVPTIKPYFLIPACWHMTLFRWVISFEGAAVLRNRRRSFIFQKNGVLKRHLFENHKKNHRRPSVTRKFLAFHMGCYADHCFLGDYTVWDKFVWWLRSDLLSLSYPFKDQT
jgi:hypothetical protein